MTMPDNDQPTPADIHEAILMLQADPPLLTKQKSGQVGNQKTKYADLPAVNTQVLSKLNALGVTWTCLPTLQEADSSGPGRFVLRYTLLHVTSGTSLTGDYPLGAGEPQKMGSAITYARRYALLAVTGVAAEDEDDDGAEGATAARRPRPAKAAATRAVPATAPEIPDAGPPAETEPRSRSRSAPAVKTDAMQRKMFALFRDMGLGAKEDREARMALVMNMIGRDVASSSDLTPAESSGVLDALEKVKGRPDALTAAVEVYQRTSGVQAATGRTASDRTRTSVTGTPDPDVDVPWEPGNGELLAQDGTTGGPR